MTRVNNARMATSAASNAGAATSAKDILRRVDELLLLAEEGVDLSPEHCALILSKISGIELGEAPPDVAPLMQEVTLELERRANSDADAFLFFNAPKGLAGRTRDLRLALGGTRFVYHGTTFGRLASIIARGLVPGAPAVWRTPDLAEHVAGRVFLTAGLNGAQNWATVAHRRSRGRRDSKPRRPIIIRIPADNLALASDPRAMASDCLMSERTIDVRGAEGLLAGSHGPLDWRSLAELDAMKDLPPLPDIYNRT